MTVPDGSPKYAAIAVPVGDGGDDLGDGLIATAPADAPPAEAQTFLEVVAPATLPEGYTFEAEANGHGFAVKVPTGGVEEGQKFSVPFPAGSTGYSGAAIPRPSVPVGLWKDGTFDCFRHGIIHPVPWNACFCPLVLLGQVMHRLKLTWLASEGGTSAQTAATFKIMLGITCVYQVTMRIPGLAARSLELEALSIAMYAANVLIVALAGFRLVLTCRTRARVRDRYGIPETHCRGSGFEDFCCAAWCGPCAVAQMARHTADYETYAGVCCSETGVPAHAPSIV